MIDIIIVDDHPIVREGLVSLVSRAQGLRVAGEAANADEALKLIRTQRFDVILLDVALPGRSGIDLLKQLHVEFPELRVLMLSVYPEKQFALRCLKAGALGYLTKESTGGELITAIHTVEQGKRYVTHTLAQQLADVVDLGTTTPLHESLSDREFEVLCMLGQGKSVAQVASLLSLSVSTVHTYRARILAKMNLESNAELIFYVLEHQLVVRH
jgi:DNA-binding NarL/FixJ family response regulator